MGKVWGGSRSKYWRKGYHPSSGANTSKKDKPTFTGIYANVDGLTENKIKEIKLICTRKYDSAFGRALTTLLDLNYSRVVQR